MGTRNDKTFWMLLPLLGSILFVLLYIVAASLYPGGSYEDLNANGFSLVHNYWCHLLNERGLNGELNDGRPVAIAAMIILAMTLLSFWILYPMQMRFKRSNRIIIWLSAFLSITAISFLSGPLHDTSINISGFFGLIAMAGAYTGIYKQGWYVLFAFGVLNLLLIAANNYIYHAERGMYYLPIIQKITFLSCLAWICLVNVRLYRLTGRPKLVTC